MADTPPKQPGYNKTGRKIDQQAIPVRIATYYALFGFMWILFSDLVLKFFTPEIDTLQHLQTIKGWLFILATTALLFFLLRRRIGAVVHAEDALRKSEDLFRRYFEFGGVGMAVIAPDGKWLRVNGRLCEILGHGRGELLRTTWAEITHPEDLTADEQLFKRLLTGEIDGYSTDKRFIRSDGGTAYTNLSVACVRNADDSVAWVIAHLSDIAARKKAQSDLLRANRALTVLNQSHRAMIENNDETDFLEAVCQIIIASGYRFSWIGMTEHNHVKSVRPVACAGYEDGYLDSIRVTWDDSETGRGPTGTAIRTGNPAVMQNIHTDPAYAPWRTKAEEQGYKSSAALPLKQQGGDVFGVLNIYAQEEDSFDSAEIDLLNELAGIVAYGISSLRTERIRRETESAFRQSEEKYSRIFNATTEAIFIHDPATGAILDVNQRMLDMYGYSYDEALRLSIGDLSADNTAEAQQKAVALVRKSMEQGPQVFEWLAQKKNGEHFWVEVSLRAYDTGKASNVLAVVRDISERKQAEQEKQLLESQLFQAQKMESIGMLAGGIAHDFNNILAAIIGYTELAFHNIPDPATKSDLRQVLSASTRAKELIQQILTFSRKTDQTLKPLMMQPIVKEAIKMLRATIPASIDMHQHIAPDTGAVLADPARINQIVVNLATNAYQAMEERGGTLAIELAGETFNDAENAKFNVTLGPGSYARLSVKDTGCGIDRETLTKVFEPYFTTKGIGKGTGMGLAVVHGLAKSYHGEIVVESEIGRGTAFHVFLPTVTAAPLPEEAVAVTLPGGHESILLVDDEESLVKFEKRALEGLGYQVVPTTSSTEALEVFRAGPADFDLVITDMTMPRISGADLARELLTIRPDIPIILVTGYSAAVSKESARAIGIKAFLMKPLQLTALAHSVRKALDQ